jgi:hypothetical protein
MQGVSKPANLSEVYHMIEAHSAVSMKKDAFEAGREAMEHSMKKMSRRPDVIWAFGASSFDQAKLLEGMRTVAGDIPLVGCTTDGEISTSGLSTDSVVVLSLASDHIQFRTLAVESLSKNSLSAGVNLGKKLQDTGCKYLQIFSDGLKGNATQIIEGIRQVLGNDIRIAGGTAGDGGEFVCTYQYFNDRLLTDSIVAVAFIGDFHLGTGGESGWIPFGVAKQVTKSIGNVVYELDGQPALQVYEKFLGKYASCLPGVGVEYPLALLGIYHDAVGTNEFICRATMGVDREKGSITFAGDVPEGSMVKMTMGNEEDIILAGENATRIALDNLTQDVSTILPRVVFIYSCMARKIVLGSRTNEEIVKIKNSVGENIPIIGFYCYGEYAPIGRTGVSSFYNETITLTIIGE